MGHGARDRGQERNGTRDAGRGTGKWEGESPAEPSFRQIVRWANRQVGKEGEWRIAKVFLEGSVPALPKIFGALGDAPSSFPSLL
jgi:hypothetical protein